MSTEAGKALVTALTPQDEARFHPQREALAGYVFDVFLRWSEEPHAGLSRELLESRRSAHQLERNIAELRAGNLFDIFAKSAWSDEEGRSLCAFAVLGMVQRWQVLPPEARERSIPQFVTLAERTTRCLSLPFFELFEILTSEEMQSAFWYRLSEEVGQDVGLSPVSPATQVVRLTALARSRSPHARRELERLRALGDPFISGLIRQLMVAHPEGVAHDEMSVEGRGSIRLPRKAWQRALRWLSGWATVEWLLRLLASLAGFGRQIRVEARGGGLLIDWELRLWGRSLRRGQWWSPFTDLKWVSREERFPGFFLLLSILALSLGIFFGGEMLAEGAAGGDTWVVLAAAGLIVVGVVFDLLCWMLYPLYRQHEGLEFCFDSRRGLRMQGVVRERAERFFAMLQRVRGAEGLGNDATLNDASSAGG